MTKKEFLDLLRYYLRKFPDNLVDDIIADYDERFRQGKDAGKSEGIIAAELGSPLEIARAFKASEYTFQRRKLSKGHQGDEKRGLSGSAIFLLGLLGLVVIFSLPIFLLLLSLIFTGVITCLALVASLIFVGGALLVDLTGLSPSSLSIQLNVHPLTQGLGGLASIALGLFCLVFGIYFIKFLFLGVRKLSLGIFWEYKKWREKE